jgi:hypothetical protein
VGRNEQACPHEARRTPGTTYPLGKACPVFADAASGLQRAGQSGCNRHDLKKLSRSGLIRQAVRPARIDFERRVLDESRRGAGCGADRNNGFSSEMDAPAWPTARRGVRETSPQLRRS